MKELYEKLNAIPGSYYAFVVGVMDYCRRSPKRLDVVKNYLSSHLDIRTSDVIEFLADQPGFLNEDEYDTLVAEDAYNEYIADGKKSRPIEELWKELDELPQTGKWDSFVQGIDMFSEDFLMNREI